MWTKTPLTAALGIELPIVQGPFGGGNSSPALAAAVSNAGALGSFGAVALGPPELRAVVRDIAARTSKPFNINLWVPIADQENAAPSPDEIERSLRHIRPFLRELGLEDPLPTARPTFEAQVEALLEARPPVWSFVMGVPDPAMLREAKKRGIATIGTATSIDEAVAIAEAGADAVVASGTDAGGHRGSFLRSAEATLIGTMSLVPQVASAVSIPTIAAGGIADGRGVVAALALGAAGVQVGSAFLVSHESAAPQAHKDALLRAEARFTRLTRVFTGRLARGIDNPLLRALEQHLEDVLAYPAQHQLTLALRKLAGTSGRDDLLALWAGQNAASARALPAAEIVSKLVRETEEILRSERFRA
jgi:nitronate monooxygenase